ncbi:hypothetical protein PR048_015141 [Dryococelus australis]|uniref:DDE Tnp4 domain-containing protein n=1 Tax=Dryococelus australis TaxID=614101 RepID=A0ABQ9HH37_9NEOP|nr:hypothetical protein PR048_015141 [Dryococelus australis]
MRFLATGESLRSLDFHFRVHYSYISVITKQTIASLALQLTSVFLPMLSEKHWQDKSSKFFTKWNFPNCHDVTTPKLFPPPCKLPNSDRILPYVLVGDEPFRLQTYLIKPFPRDAVALDGQKAVFNYRFSRARKVSENAFALLAKVFRIFYSPINLRPDTVDDCSLDDQSTQNLQPTRRQGGFANKDGFRVINDFDYFNCYQGQVPWQETIRRYHIDTETLALLQVIFRLLHFQISLFFPAIPDNADQPREKSRLDCCLGSSSRLPLVSERGTRTTAAVWENKKIECALYEYLAPDVHG